MTYDVFISYRRENGAQMAQLLLARLQGRGYRVFLDVSELRAGHFDRALYTSIEKSRSFILVLSPGCLERCKNEGDWLRHEIEYALKTKKPIIPVLLPGFNYPNKEDMPQSLHDLELHQSVEFTHLYLDAMLNKLCGYLCKPRSARRRLVLALLAALGALLLAVRGLYRYTAPEGPPTPSVTDQIVQERRIAEEKVAEAENKRLAAEKEQERSAAEQRMWHEQEQKLAQAQREAESEKRRALELQLEAEKRRAEDAENARKDAEAKSKQPQLARDTPTPSDKPKESDVHGKRSAQRNSPPKNTNKQPATASRAPTTRPPGLSDDEYDALKKLP